jgi:hypothetical protein
MWRRFAAEEDRPPSQALVGCNHKRMRDGGLSAWQSGNQQLCDNAVVGDKAKKCGEELTWTSMARLRSEMLHALLSHSGSAVSQGRHVPPTRD